MRTLHNRSNHIRNTLVGLFLCLSSTNTLAERDYGNTDCGSWIENQKQDHSMLHIADLRWLGGYLSGLNTGWSAFNKNSIDPLKELNSMNQAKVWMDNYCNANPLSNLKEGSVKLFGELLERKKKQK